MTSNNFFDKNNTKQNIPPQKTATKPPNKQTQHREAKWGNSYSLLPISKQYSATTWKAQYVFWLLRKTNTLITSVPLVRLGQLSW